MRRLWWIPAAVVGLVISGAVALLATGGGARTETVATGVKPESAAVLQTQSSQAAPAPVREAQQAQKPAAAPAAPARPAPEGPRRVETTQYDSWTVTCEETVGGTAKKSCLANLRMVNQDRGTVLNWQIGQNPQGQYITAIHIPSALSVKSGENTIGGPISIQSGIELKFGNAAVRRLNFTTCGPQQCVAEALIDDTFIKEANANTKATVTIHTPGGVIPFELEIKGIDKAISFTR